MFIEKQSWGETHYEVVPGSHVSFQTERQKVDLISNPRFGRMLFLDGVLQSATMDEKIYHNQLTDLARLVSSKDVLIVGGSEGAVARDVCEYKNIEHIDMVDWDEELVNYLWKTEWYNKDAFEDPRLSYIPQDILKYLDAPKRTYDTVILDLLDINTEEDYNFTQNILKKLKSCIKHGRTTVVLNVGSSSALAQVFGGEVVEIFVPSFQEPWYLVKLLM
jgi:spermidine synthase